MSSNIIVDSSGFFSLYVETDSNNFRSIKASETLAKEKKLLIVPDAVFLELINALGKKINHDIAEKVAQYILHSKTYVLENTSREIALKSLAIFREQPRSISFTDCIVMVFADEFGTKEIFGFDEAFRKNGYIRIGIDKNPLAP